MSRESEEYANPELVGGGETSLHSHAGGGSINIKSGTVSGLSGSVTFNTAFSSTPRVVMTVQGTTALRDCLFKVVSVSTTGFSWEADASMTLSWIATNVGNS